MKAYYRNVLIILLTVSGSAGAEMYRWVDDHGRVHFGDKPTSRADVKLVKPQNRGLHNPAKTSKPKFKDPEYLKEVRKTSHLPPGEFRKQLEEMEHIRKQAILKTQHEAQIDYEQKLEASSKKQQKRRDEAEHWEKRQALAEKKRMRKSKSGQPKFDKEGNMLDSNGNIMPRKERTETFGEKIIRENRARERSWRTMEKLHGQY